MRAELRGAARRVIEQAALAGYPHEVCGVLLGRGGDLPLIEEAHPCGNLNAERSRDRYELDPAMQLRIEKGARERGLDVLGYYHSHPDHPADASETDNGLSWESTLYLIQAVQAGACGPLKAWHRSPGQARLAEAQLQDA